MMNREKQYTLALLETILTEEIEGEEVYAMFDRRRQLIAQFYTNA